MTLEFVFDTFYDVDIFIYEATKEELTEFYLKYLKENKEKVIDTLKEIYDLYPTENETFSVDYNINSKEDFDNLDENTIIEILFDYESDVYTYLGEDIDAYFEPYAYEKYQEESLK